MECLFACRTDVGRVRTNNEDSFAHDSKRGLFVVCDGMGGHSAGEVASRLAAEAVIEHLAAGAHLRARFAGSNSFDDLWALQQHMAAALAHANQRIFEQARAQPEQRGMGTTCTALMLMAHHKAVLGHVGDSRMYLLRHGELFAMTCDHTYVNELVKRGALTAEQAADHPQNNILSRAMGVQAEVPVQTWTFDYQSGDTFLLCSDGVYTYFPNNVGLGARMADDSLETGLGSIIGTALTGGGHDNCTGILVRLPPNVAAAGPSLQETSASVGAWPLFAALTPLQRLAVIGLGKRQTLQPGATLVAAGAPLTGLVLVLAGSLALQRDGQTIRQLGVGEAMGQRALLGPTPQHDAIVAVQPSAVFRLSHRAFTELVRQDPEIGSRLLHAILRAVGTGPAAEAAQPASGS